MWTNDQINHASNPLNRPMPICAIAKERPTVAKIPFVSIAKWLMRLLCQRSLNIVRGASAFLDRYRRQAGHQVSARVFAGSQISNYERFRIPTYGEVGLDLEPASAASPSTKD
jgi:hypothetical protein